MKADTNYTIVRLCSNCSGIRVIWIPKGKTILKYELENKELMCIICGCNFWGN